MKRLLPPQSELSAASAIFYSAGAALAALSFSVLRMQSQAPSYVNLATAVVATIAAIGFLVVGRRASTAPALVLMTLASVLVLYLSSIAATELRVLNAGLLYFTFLFYMIWFGPIWYARVFGVAWLTGLWTIAIFRFGSDVLLTLVTLTLTSSLLAELVALFKRRLGLMSLMDPLCEVWNNRGIRERLDRALRIARRSSRPLSVVYFDLDAFKGVNDQYGHAAGDRVLQEFAARATAGTRPEDELGRVGGDEFLLIMPGATEAAARTAMDRLRNETEGRGWSFGVSELAPNDTLEDLITRADQRMYDEKQRRRGAGQQPH